MGCEKIKCVGGVREKKCVGAVRDLFSVPNIFLARALEGQENIEDGPSKSDVQYSPSVSYVTIEIQLVH